MIRHRYAKHYVLRVYCLCRKAVFRREQPAVNPNYDKPPITEAIIDLRVMPRPGASALELAPLLRDSSEEFPIRQELPDYEALQLPDDMRRAMGMPATPVLGGFRYESESHQRVVQLRRDGFVFSFAGTPESLYPGWDSFSNESRSIWNEYQSAWKPQGVRRIALRYVNQFPLDSVKNSFPTILQSANPPRPQNMPQNMVLSGYTSQISLQYPDSGASAVINRALIPLRGIPNFVLDIDIFQDGLNIDASSEELWQRLERLREQKNDLFRAFITDDVEETLGVKL